MRETAILEKIAELHVSLPPMADFQRMADLTALRQDATGRFYRSNLERGPLLYGLVAKHRPRAILEFGTGRGYGAFCMARALVEHGINGRVYTIDVRRYTDKLPWWIDFGSGPEVRDLSWSEVWPHHFDAQWLDRVTRLTGLSSNVMAQWKTRGLPKVDFAFIDGGHDYLTVKHDFYSVLDVSNQSFQVLFDDFTVKPGYGVCRLVDEDILPHFHSELIWWHRQDGQPGEQAAQPASGMVFINGRCSQAPGREALAPEDIQDFLATYRRQSRRSQRNRTLKAPLRLVAKTLRLR